MIDKKLINRKDRKRDGENERDNWRKWITGKTVREKDWMTTEKTENKKIIDKSKQKSERQGERRRE